MRDTEIKNTLVTLHQRAMTAKRKCLFDTCELPAISSHLLQKRGIISQVSERNHVYELAIDHHKKHSFYFRQTGVNKAFSFPGFCTHHDNSLFKEIETGEINFDEYRTQLLFSYRALMNERRKKEINVDYYERILNSFKLRLYLSSDFISHIRSLKEQELLGISDGKHSEYYFLLNINDFSARDFTFLTIELPKVEVCSSAVFTYETTQEISHIYQNENYKIKAPLTDIFFNLLPFKDKAVAIFGCLNERIKICGEYIESFRSSDPDVTLKKISDLLLCQVENWLCSPKIYRASLRQKEKQIIQITQESLIHPNERRSVNINLFSNRI